jgi:deoxycytidylate deaminase
VRKRVKMSACKRNTVYAIGMTHGQTAKACNYNEGECTNEIGNCGCKHAEIALLEKMPNPNVVVVSMSPCKACAEALISAGVRLVMYQEEYRLTEGLELLKKSGVECIKPDYSAEKWRTLWEACRIQA